MAHNFVVQARWNDLIGYGVSRTGASAPSLTAWRGGNILLLKFSNATVNELNGVVQFPHSYVEGTAIKPHVHWVHDSGSDDGNVVWQMDYAWANNVTEQLGAGSNLNAADAVLATEQYYPQLLSLGSISGTGKKVSSLIAFRFFRDPTVGGDSTSSAGVFLLGVDFHFQVDGFGSTAENTKF